jgi:hypothetical protein
MADEVDALAVESCSKRAMEARARLLRFAAHRPILSDGRAQAIATKKTPQPVFTVRGPILGGCTSERALELIDK